MGGGSAGHKGLESIINSLGTNKFIRIRIGIGKPQNKEENIRAEYVLSKIPKSEMGVIKIAIEKSAMAGISIVNDGLISAMNKFNRSVL